MVLVWGRHRSADRFHTFPFLLWVINDEKQRVGGEDQLGNDPLLFLLVVRGSLIR